MLAVTENAASAVSGILASSELPAEAGLRITTEPVQAEEGVERTDLRLSVVEGPEESDQVIDEAPIFLEPEAAALLDDKLLDAEVVDDQVNFRLAPQG